MAPRVQHKRSAVAGKAPQPADLEYGEIGVNYEASDPALYVKDSANAIRKISPQVDATTSAKGVVQLATGAEVTTGTDAVKAVTPATLKTELDKKANQATTYTKAETDTALALKANLASPALTGTPTAPTAAAGTNTTQLATTEFVTAAIAGKSASGSYEEGTFTPVLQFGGASDGMSGTFSGAYTKIGNIVHIRVNISLANKGTSTGAATISGLPFASPHEYSLSWYTEHLKFATGGAVGTKVVMFRGSPSGKIDIRMTTDQTITADIPDANFFNNTHIVLNGSFTTV